MSLADLAKAATKLGRPTLPTAIHKIERGTRQITVDELMTFAIALDTTPNHLLFQLPGGPDEESPLTKLTPTVEVRADQAWLWAFGRGRTPTQPPSMSSFDVWALERENQLFGDEKDKLISQVRDFLVRLEALPDPTSR